MALNYDNIASTTLQLIRKKMADAIFKANPFLGYLLAKGRTEIESGGKWIETPLMYAKNNLVQSYRGYDQLNVGPTEEFTMAKYNWRQAAVPIAISGLEGEIQNAGPAAFFNLFSQKVKVAEMSFKEWLNEKMLAATSTKDLTRDFLGLDEIIENTAEVSQGTLGGISKTTYPWWRNRRTKTADISGASGTNRMLYRAMITFWNNCTKGQSTPDLILADQTDYEWYEKETDTLARYNHPQDTGLLNLGFTSLKFKGADLMWDEYQQTDHMHFINTKHMKFVIHKNRNFVMSPFVKPYMQDAKVAHMMLAGQLVCDNCRHQGILEVDGAPS